MEKTARPHITKVTKRVFQKIMVDVVVADLMFAFLYHRSHVQQKKEPVNSAASYANQRPAISQPTPVREVSSNKRAKKTIRLKHF